MRRIWATVAWSVASSAMGCLILGLLGQNVSVANPIPLMLAGAQAYGLPVALISVFASVSGAIIGDLPGLQRPYSQVQALWMEGQHSSPAQRVVREQLWLVLGWAAVLLLVALVVHAPVWLWLFFAVLGTARALQLGRHLHMRRAIAGGKD